MRNDKAITDHRLTLSDIERKREKDYSQGHVIVVRGHVIDALTIFHIMARHWTASHTTTTTTLGYEQITFIKTIVNQSCMYILLEMILLLVLFFFSVISIDIS